MAANTAYLRATRSSLPDLLGRKLFDVFPNASGYGAPDLDQALRGARILGKPYVDAARVRAVERAG